MKKQFLPFVSFWVLDSALLYVASLAFPTYFVLGNKSMSALWAAIASGLVWSFILWIGVSANSKMLKLKGALVMFGYYFLANFVALWLTARMAPVFGFGVVSFVWLALLAVIADVLQYGVWVLGKFKEM